MIVPRYKDMSAVYAAKKKTEPTSLLSEALKTSPQSELDSLPRLLLPTDIEERLYDHQRIGVNWMYNLYCKDSGGILGDDMGLGKTFQVISLLIGLMLTKQIMRVLILAPVVVLPNWQREITEYLLAHIPAADVYVLNSDMPKRRRLAILEETFSCELQRIIISSHQTVSNMIKDFTQGTWDYVILDEGHVIKNPATQMFKAMRSLSSRHRLLLTGTPIQNNLDEFWAVVDWATNGRTFGSLSNFTKMVADPIAKGQHPKATEFQVRVANESRDILQRITRPILLQRTKREQSQIKLPEKKELVLWISLSSEQRAIYESYTKSSIYSSAFNRSTYPVEVINYLKTLCRHPVLLEVAIKKKNAVADMNGLTDAMTELNMTQFEGEDVGAYGVGHLFEAIQRKPSLEEFLRGSLKLRILIKMLKALVDDNHRVLVFSQSKLMLQIIQHLLIEFDYASYKIDGSTSLRERQEIIDDFNNTSAHYSGPPICLLTTKACGCGITLTGADRVIIFDPCKIVCPCCTLLCFL
jgi:DNA excision repair protein ERCC-6-like